MPLLKILKIRSIIVLLFFMQINTIEAQDKLLLDTNKEQTQEQQTIKPRLQISDYITVGALIDAQYTYNAQILNSGDVNQSSIFRIRRARLDFKGTITPKISFRLHTDFASSPKLLDAFVKIKFCQQVELQVGQFKIPFSLENAYSSYNLEFSEKAQVISALAGHEDISGVKTFSNGREIGLMLSGVLARFESQGQKYPLLSYSIGVFGGNGINVKNDNMAKDISGRINFSPFLKNFVLSGSVYYGNYAILDSLDGLRLRCAGGAEYKNDCLTVRAEYVWGKTGLLAMNESNIPFSKNISTHGFYVVAGYWFNFGWGQKSNVTQKMRPVLRYDYYQQDILNRNTNSIYYSLGIDWWPEKHLRFVLNYTLCQYIKYKKPSHCFTTMLTIKV